MSYISKIDVCTAKPVRHPILGQTIGNAIAGQQEQAAQAEASSGGQSQFGAGFYAAEAALQQSGGGANYVQLADGLGTNSQAVANGTVTSSDIIPGYNVTVPTDPSNATELDPLVVTAQRIPTIDAQPVTPLDLDTTLPTINLTSSDSGSWLHNALSSGLHFIEGVGSNIASAFEGRSSDGGSYYGLPAPVLTQQYYNSIQQQKTAAQIAEHASANSPAMIGTFLAQPVVGAAIGIAPAASLALATRFPAIGGAAVLGQNLGYSALYGVPAAGAGGVLIAKSGVADSVSVLTGRVAGITLDSPVPSVALNSLTATHGVTLSRSAYYALSSDIAANGIQNPISYVSVGNAKYIVDGNNRFSIAQGLGLTTVPAKEVSLPFAGYKSNADLFDYGH